jgi:ATP-dependent HslUV protease ATP-binding subunit HslU
MGNAAKVGIISIIDILKGSNTTFQEVEKTTIEAIEILTEEYANDMIDEKAMIAKATKTVQENGVVFIDEFDKIISSKDSSGGRGEVSREGVQRDLLPVVEGSAVSTKYGIVNTDHVLFIAAGAFHYAKPSDLIPELQGRFPIRVELENLTKNDFVRILQEPKNSLIKQYQALFGSEGVHLTFTEDAVEKLAETAMTINEQVENIGARRLHTILSQVLNEYLYNMPELLPIGSALTITGELVDLKLKSLVKNRDLSQYIL